MNLCLPYTPCLVHPLGIVTWIDGCPCVSPCLCPIHPGFGSTSCLECVHASVHEFMSTWLLMSGPPHVHSLMETWVPLYRSVCVPVISFLLPHLVYNVYMHQYMNLCLPYTPCLVHRLWIVTFKVGCPCVSLHVCPSHLIFVPTPCLECVQASVHEFMSTWLLMSGPAPRHSLMETWVPLYGSVFVSQSSHFLFRMCTCISTWIYVYLTPHVWSTP